MGGRGASSPSGIYTRGKRKKEVIKYGSEYTSLLQVGNVKYVVWNGGRLTKAPQETQVDKTRKPKGRVYATVNQKTEKVQYITFYDAQGKLYKQIDVGGNHDHLGRKSKVSDKSDIWHVHFGYNHGMSGDRDLTSGEYRVARAIISKWRPEYVRRYKARSH